jgi:hypothetical protein
LRDMPSRERPIRGDGSAAYESGGTSGEGQAYRIARLSLPARHALLSRY